MVITAASCFFDEKTKKPLNMNDYSVVLGTNDPMNVTEGFERRLSRVMIHPKYKYPQVCTKIKLSCPSMCPKRFLTSRNCFGLVQFVLDGLKTFWTCLRKQSSLLWNHFWTFWTCPNWFGWVQNHLHTVFPHIVSTETILFLNLEIQESQYIRPKVTTHKCAETIQGRKLFKGRNYMRKYGMSKVVLHLEKDKAK